jgi:hypothetical protein
MENFMNTILDSSNFENLDEELMLIPITSDGTGAAAYGDFNCHPYFIFGREDDDFEDDDFEDDDFEDDFDDDFDDDDYDDEDDFDGFNIDDDFDGDFDDE